MKLSYPFRDDVILTQSFEQHLQVAEENGWCTAPGTCPGGIYYYPAIDWAKAGGCEIIAAVNAPVSLVEFQGAKVGYGMRVCQQWKEDNINWMLVYAHLVRASVKVKKGDILKIGDVIGWMDNTGNSTGTHLHFELRKNGMPVDPMLYLSDNQEPIPDGSVIVIADVLNVRKSPMQVEGNIIGTVLEDTILKKTGQEGDWIAIQFSGYVHKDWIRS